MLLLALALMAPPATGPTSPYPPDPECAQRTTYDMAQCLLKQGLVWDQRLNAEYKAALERVPPRARPALRRAQSAWIKYRDTNCEMYSLHEGSVAQLWSAGCPLDMTRKRTLELHDMD